MHAEHIHSPDAQTYVVHDERVHRSFSLRRAFTDNSWTFSKLRTRHVPYNNRISSEQGKVYENKSIIYYNQSEILMKPHALT